MELWMLSALLPVALLIWFFSQKKPKTKEQSTTHKAPSPAQWHAVSVNSCRNACKAVQDVQDKRFLSREAPLLPLINCTNAQCTCSFIHFSDRRAGKKRRAESVRYSDSNTKDKRVQKPKGRRKLDMPRPPRASSLSD